MGKLFLWITKTKHYTGTLTVTYNGNATIAAEVKFTVKPLPVPTYPVTINGGEGSGTYGVGEKVTITAIVPEGRHFTGWTVDAGNVNLENPSSPTTTFTMPGQAVTITANWSDDSGSGDDSSGKNPGGDSDSSGGNPGGDSDSFGGNPGGDSDSSGGNSGGNRRLVFIVTILIEKEYFYGSITQTGGYSDRQKEARTQKVLAVRNQE